MNKKNSEYYTKIMNKKNSGYYTKKELEALGLKSFGENVLLSKQARIFNPEKLVIGNNSRIDDFTILVGNIEIGNYVHVAAFSLLSGMNGIRLEDFVGLSVRGTILTSDGDYSKGSTLTSPMIPEKFRTYEKGEVIMGKHSVVGAHSVILPSTHIGNGAMFGALSLLKGTYKGWYLYVGIPARPVRKRPMEKILKFEKAVMKMDIL